MKASLVILAASACALAGCAKPTDPSAKNFGAAISQYLDKKGELCLRLNKWPVDLSEADMRMLKSLPTGEAAQMQALASIGLVTGVDAQVVPADNFGWNGPAQKMTVKRYTLTEAGKKYYREQEVTRIGIDGVGKGKQGDICYGKKALEKVVKWEGPMKFGDYQEANVIYLYRIDKLADWARSREFAAAFPHAARLVEEAGKKEQQGAVKLTSLGWEPKALD